MIRSFIVESTCNNMRIDRWLRNKLGKVPQSLIEKSLRLGKIKINKKKIKSSFKIKTNDKIELFNFDFKEKIKHEKKQFNPSIHYELQLGTYGYAVKEKFGQLDGMYLYYYNKDTSAMRAVEVPLTYVSRAYLFWRNLNDEHKMGLPGFRVGISPVQKWQCNYCQFKSRCNPPT